MPKKLASATSPADRSAAIDPLGTAINCVVPGLDALLSTLRLGREATPSAISNSPEAADANALRAARQALAQHLKNSDMTALQSMAELQQRYGRFWARR